MKSDLRSLNTIDLESVDDETLFSFLNQDWRADPRVTEVTSLDELEPDLELEIPPKAHDVSKHLSEEIIAEPPPPFIEARTRIQSTERVAEPLSPEITELLEGGAADHPGSIDDLSNIFSRPQTKNERVGDDDWLSHLAIEEVSSDEEISIDAALGSGEE